MPTLERALALAAGAHEGQRKNAEPVILHVIRVVLLVEDPDGRIVAALHDVVEKTDWTLEELRIEGFSERVVQGVDAMTRREGEDWEDYVARAGADPLGRLVKPADVVDNLTHTDPSDLERIRRYQQALRTLKQ